MTFLDWFIRTLAEVAAGLVIAAVVGAVYLALIWWERRK